VALNLTLAEDVKKERRDDSEEEEQEERDREEISLCNGKPEGSVSREVTGVSEKRGQEREEEAKEACEEGAVASVNVEEVAWDGDEEGDNVVFSFPLSALKTLRPSS